MKYLFGINFKLLSRASYQFYN